MTIRRFRTVLGAEGAEEARRAETRRRVEQTVAMLRDGRRHP